MRMQQMRIYTDQWEERAEKVLSRFNYNFPDEIDMHDICWRYGIKIMPLDDPFTGQYIDFETVSHLRSFSIPKTSDKHSVIFLKEGLGSIEKKLLLAEEFCHLHAHHSSQLGMNKYAVEKLENQAMKMAAYLLMPARFINSVYEAAYDEAVVISDIADYFLVTEEFAHYRLELIFNRRVDAFVSHWGMLGTFEWFE